MDFPLKLSVHVNNKLHITTIAARIGSRSRDRAYARARAVLADSQRRVPVDTGDLKASGHIEILHSINPTRLQVVYDMPYAGFIEYGTVKMDAQPYLTPALEAERAGFLGHFRDIA